MENHKWITCKLEDNTRTWQINEKKVSETAWGENGVNTAKNVLYRLAFGQKALTIFQNAYDLPQTSMTVPHAELETWRFCLSGHFIGELILRGL